MNSNKNLQLKSVLCVQKAIIEELYVPITLRDKISLKINNLSQEENISNNKSKSSKKS